jgi:uncharacterized protein YfeS
MSKIYQKNYLLKEVDTIIRECKKIQVLMENNAVSSVVKRIMLFENLLKQKTMGNASQKLKDRVADILEKDSEIKRLEKSIQ